MAVKTVDVPDIGPVALYRRKGVRGVRLSITHDGTVRVTLPTWAPYRLGIEFVRNKAEWIASKRPSRRLIQTGDRVGKAHRFIFEQRPGQAKVASRITGTDIRLTLPMGLRIEDMSVQKTAENAAVRALKKEGLQLLPQRLAALAQQHGFNYRSVGVKRLKSRWGSCNERQDIVLNCFLMQLPWHLIDYVLLHELVHTKMLRHGEPFWKELGRHVRELKEIRKEMKSFQPALVIEPGPGPEELLGQTRPVLVDTI